MQNVHFSPAEHAGMYEVLQAILAAFSHAYVAAGCLLERMIVALTVLLRGSLDLPHSSSVLFPKSTRITAADAHMLYWLQGPKNVLDRVHFASCLM
jgi:hypothetical protein